MDVFINLYDASDVWVMALINRIGTGNFEYYQFVAFVAVIPNTSSIFNFNLRAIFLYAPPPYKYVFKALVKNVHTVMRAELVSYELWGN